MSIIKNLYYALEYKRTARTLSQRIRQSRESSSDAMLVVIDRLEARSGGLRNVGRIVNALAVSLKRKTSIYIQNSGKQDAALIKEYQFEGELIDHVPEGVEIIVSSTWALSEELKNYVRKNHSKWIHIIQDYDELFFPVSTKYFYAANVKSGPDAFISSGKWMTLPGRVAGLPFPVDSQIYHELTKPNVEREVDVLFFHKPELPRRCAFLCEQIAEQLLTNRPSLRIAFYGSNLSKHLVSAKVEHFGAVPSIQELADLYRRSKIGISSNLTNPSLIPFELAACGCLPLSPYLNSHPEFHLPEIHVNGGIDEIVKKILSELDSENLPGKCRKLSEWYLAEGYICDRSSFADIVGREISAIKI
ncbi:hypothetical protein PCE31106_04573 [Pandoraea cepalis]|uniref:WsaF C-terminal domain-containing protein n=1 Tax=Pandoraea cepalis TaxID=2508294 RepID=A0A5E4YL80_9BURK|nr:glycosyltransferase [Pandoraea cepalis]VVE49292.1 hypothetical protein PCE31106_04573 [Pandoraea cepalis]